MSLLQQCFVCFFIYILVRSSLCAHDDVGGDGGDNITIVASSRHLRRRPADAERTVDFGQLWTTARNYLCVPLLRIFTLQLEQPLSVGEHVGLIGNHLSLGEWQVDRSLAMRPKDSGRMRWYLRVPLCTRKRIRYRYFIYTLDSYGRKRLLWWEPLHYARVLEHYQMFRSILADDFGAIFKNLIGEVEKERGWLRNEYQIEFKFVWARHFRWFRTRVPRMRLKLLLLNEESSNDTDVEVSQYADRQSKFQQQPRDGVAYTPGNIVIIRVTARLHVRNTYQLVIASPDGTEIGEVLILPTDLYGNDGVVDLAVHSSIDGYHIGWLTLPYLIVRPLPNAKELSFLAGFHHFWPLNWPVLDVGHRGAGKSFYQSYAAQVENTIASLLYVGRLEGDMVQLDVQFTSDYVPVLWHDYGFYTVSKRPVVSQASLTLEYVYIRDLTYAQLKRKRVFVMKGAQLQEFSHLNVRNTTVLGRIFPKLSDVYRAVSKTIAMNVDVKWPQLLENDEMQAHDSLDKNLAANVLIQITGRFSCGRALIFSSFDADLCTMLRYKQNVFPVMLTTAGSSNMWRAYKDLRTQSFRQAVNYAEAANILGTSTHVEDLLRNETLVDAAIDLGQVVFVWGDDLMDYDMLAKFRDLQVTGLIYDRMDLYAPIRKRKRFFHASELDEIYAKQCEAIGGLSYISRQARDEPLDGGNVTLSWASKVQIKKPETFVLPN